MSRSETLLQWTACVSSNLPQLSVSQARVLAWWSFGIAMTGSCGRLTVATFLGLLCGQKVNTVEQRLYEWCLDAKDKGGKHRRELVLPTCQVALLEWIVRLWVGTQLALALDATSLGDRFVVIPPDLVLGDVVADRVFVLRRAPRVRAGLDDEGSGLGKTTFVPLHGMLE